MIKKLLAIVGSLVVIATAVTVGYQIDHRWTYSCDFVAFVNSTKQRFLSDTRLQLEQLIWKLEVDFGPGCKSCPPGAKATYEKIQRELRDTNEKLEKLRNSK